MLPELKGRGLFVFSDPGGAKPLLSLIKMNTEVKEYTVVSDRMYDFYSDFGIPVQQYTPGDEERVIDQLNPDYVFTGTSYTSKIELKFIHAAKQKNIPAYSFIDHYTSFAERFYFNGVYEFPGYICVTDEKALGIGLQQNLPSPIIVTGNYYHEFLKQWKPVVSKKEFFRQSGIPVHNKLIVFAPDPLTNVGGKEKIGLDELTVHNDVVKSLKKVTDIKFTFALKLHPNQKPDDIVDATKKSGLDFIYAETLHTNTLLYYSDLVIGMFSGILIESCLFDKNVIRYLKGLKQNDPLYDNNIGVVVKDELTLEEQLRFFLNKPSYAAAN